MWPFGGYFWPSAVIAFENGNPLTVYFVLASTMLWAVITPLFVRESRRIFRADAEGPLVLLGAGEQLISQAQDKAVRRHNKLLNLTFGRPANIAHIMGLWSHSLLREDYDIFERWVWACRPCAHLAWGHLGGAACRGVTHGLYGALSFCCC
jgi:hypothetical protein